MGRDLGIVVLSIISWDFRYQRPQHLLSNLARLGYRVLYVNTMASLSWRTSLQKVEPGLVTFDPAGSGCVKNLLMQRNTLKELVNSIEQAIKVMGFKDYLLWIDSPYWEPVLDFLAPQLMIYNCMDEFCEFSDLAPMAQVIQTQERKILATADVTLVTTDYLHRTKGTLARRVELVPNAADTEFFKRAALEEFPRPQDLPERSRYIVGYYGAIAEWFDFAVVKSIAQQLPDIAVVLVGAVTVDHETVKECSNVYFLGEKPYSQLPSYLKYFDVAIIPFLNNRLTLATDPVKMYEYLAAGKPVVAIDLPEIRKYADVVELAEGPEDFVRKVLKCLSSIGYGLEFQEIGTWMTPEQRMARVRHENWVERSKQVHNLIQSLLNFPRLARRRRFFQGTHKSDFKSKCSFGKG